MSQRDLLTPVSEASQRLSELEQLARAFAPILWRTEPVRRGGQRFDVDDLAVAQALAGHLALSMSAEREIDQLGMAIISRLVIGRAEGILMERLGISADQAFDYLRCTSNGLNRKLVSVASDIARTRELPDLA